jgi:hypothetical protein
MPSVPHPAPRHARLPGYGPQVGSQTFNRLGALTAVIVAILFAALHYWSPH